MICIFDSEAFSKKCLQNLICFAAIAKTKGVRGNVDKYLFGAMLFPE
jgi:hypothetical protein